MPESLLRLPQVRALIGLSRSTIYLKIHRGEFPPLVSLGARAVAWRESAINAWIAARETEWHPTEAAVQQ